MSHALVLFAHGSRNPEWGRSLAALADEVRRCDTSVDVRTAFLELQEPGLDEVIDALVAGGQRRVDVFPVFWAAGSHVAVDAPAILKAARERHAGLDARLLPAISDVPGLTAWLASTVLSLCVDRPSERPIMKES